MEENESTFEMKNVADMKAKTNIIQLAYAVFKPIIQSLGSNPAKHQQRIKARQLWSVFSLQYDLSQSCYRSPSLFHRAVFHIKDLHSEEEISFAKDLLSQFIQLNDEQWQRYFHKVFLAQLNCVRQELGDEDTETDNSSHEDTPGFYYF